MAGDYKELLEAIDEAIGNMIKQLELVHTNVFSTSSSGKASEDGTSDESLALRLQKRELDNLSLLLSDKRMARSIAEAVQSDGQVLTETLSQEHIVARDRELARQLTDGAEALDADDPDVHSEPEELDDELLAKMQVLYVSGLTETRHGLDHPEEGQAESSASGARRAIDPASITRQCEACREEKKFFDLARTPCRHEYCRPCLEKLFETAMTDESLFPPHCCSQPIPMTTVRIFLKSELVHLFEKKKVEFATPNRTYCCSPICSEFINVEHIRGDVATCPECGTTTCTMCKAATHGGDCPNDKALQQVLATASENHWQRCYSCRTVVELDHGCNHMTCRCGAEFCYVCGQKWKTCACEQWDEQRLFAHANHHIDREPDPLIALLAAHDGPQPLANPLVDIPVLPLPGDIVIARIIQDLLDHRCDHEQWRRVEGPHRCEECDGVLWGHIFECRNCRFQACNRCRRERL